MYRTEPVAGLELVTLGEPPVLRVRIPRNEATLSRFQVLGLRDGLTAWLLEFAPELLAPRELGR